MAKTKKFGMTTKNPEGRMTLGVLSTSGFNPLFNIRPPEGDPPFRKFDFLREGVLFHQAVNRRAAQLADPADSGHVPE